MTSVGEFLFGGSQSQNTGSNSSSGTSSSQNQSTSASNQASASNSVQQSQNGSNNYNQSYAPVAAAMTPTLGYTAEAGNAMASLLGLPSNNFSYNQTPYTPAAAPAPTTAKASTPNLSGILSRLMPSASPTATPAVASQNAVTQATPPSDPHYPGTYGSYAYVPPRANELINNTNATAGPSEVPGQGVPALFRAKGGPVKAGHPVIVGEHQAEAFLPQHQINAHARMPYAKAMQDPTFPHSPMLFRALGGPVAAGQPTVVGEHQPEMFVPKTDGYIVPQVQGMPPDGRTPPPGSPPPVNPGAPMAQPGGMMQKLAHGGRTNVPPAAPVPTPTATPTATTAPAATPPTTWTPSPVDANSGLNNFANSAGMNFILNQGQQAISGASASNGVFDSGATGQALTRYGQQVGQQYLDDYMNQLGNLGRLGLGGASAMSGAGQVGTSYGDSSGASSSASGGISNSNSSGSATGSQTSSGSTQGSGDSKKGLL